MMYFRNILATVKQWFRPRERIPVRTMYSIAVSVTLASFAAVLLANLTSTQPSRISLSLSEPVVRVEQQFRVGVYVDATVPVNAVSLDIAFDDTAVEILGIDRGESVITLWTEDPKVDNDAVLLRGGTYRRGFLGRHLIATIRAKAIEPSNAEFDFLNVQLLSGDGTGDILPFTTQDNQPIIRIVASDEPLVPASVPVRTLADFGADEKISMREISIFMAAWSNRDVMYDFNNDGRMNLRDFSILLYRYFANR